jgi:hypothetical protein
VRGYERLSLNPPPIRLSLVLMLLLGRNRFEEVTLKSKDLFSSRVAVKETTGDETPDLAVTSGPV